MPAVHRPAGGGADEVTAAYVRARTGLLAGSAPGAPLRRALSDLTDDWLADVFAVSGAGSIGANLVAVGGLGRREPAPGSDLDLLLLHPPDADPKEVARLADRLWYPLWDNGIRLDHSVRTPAQARRLATQDLRVVLGLLDARPLAGDADLLRLLREPVLADWRASAPDRLAELRRTVEERVERAGELAYLLEPDLKESHGGLREVVTLRAVAASWVTDAPLAGIAAPYAFLLDVRDGLHLVTGRGPDRLVRQEQAAVARLLGHDDADALLRAVSGAGRAIAFASDTVWHRVQRLARRPRGGPRVRGAWRRPGPERSPLADGVVVQDGEVVLATGARPERDPLLLLRVAAAAAQAGLRVAPHAVERLAARSAPLPEPWPAPARDALVSLLGAGRPALPVWEAYDQAGVWSRLLPGWEQVRNAPQHNPVHRYTVDRHLVETAVAAAALTRTVDRPDLLLVGALLHDIGKGRGGDHTLIGRSVVADLAPRLGFDRGEVRTLVRLVAHHLLLPETALGRDLADPATVAGVAAAVGTPEFLELLHALAVADGRATGPAAWSEWKQALVADLVRRTAAALDPSVAPPPVPDPGELTAALDAEPGEGVRLLVRRTTGSPLLTVAVSAPDRPGLLATVAGVLALHRLQVRAAQVDPADATGGARAAQVWTVQPAYGDPPATARLREELTRALTGDLDVRSRLAAREVPVSATAPAARVEVVPGASERATVLEVRAHDAPGLLHRVAGAITAAGAGIRAARVATHGSEAVDTFYLLDAAGGPLPAARARQVRAAVLAALDAGPAPSPAQDLRPGP